MDNPKISVLIPMYNRKQYAAQCIDSALNQTFQDYEIVIRDDCSNDGVFEFVQEKYAQQISDGKIRLYRNKKNLRETQNTKKLFFDARGKYIKFLHNDDMILPYALQHLYEVAEKNNADVVHESGRLDSKPDGVINDLKIDCKPFIMERNIFNRVMIMPNDPISRFNEWVSGGTFCDIQYNLFKRDFIIENANFIDGGTCLYYSLWWMMTAKVFVKTPVVCYVRRNTPDNQTNEPFSIQKMANIILNISEILNHMDKHFQEVEFFKNNEYFQYIAKAHMTSVSEDWSINRHKIYANGITPEIYDAIADAFKKYFGHDYFYPMYWFNFARVAPFNRRVDIINFENTTPPHYNINNIISEAA